MGLWVACETKCSARQAAPGPGRAVPTPARPLPPPRGLGTRPVSSALSVRGFDYNRCSGFCLLQVSFVVYDAVAFRWLARGLADM